MKTLSSLGYRQQAALRHLLNNSDGLTLDQLASLLGISRNAVTQHISVLEGLDCVESFILPSAGGRPSRAYKLTKTGLAMFPKQYALFSTMLLKSVSNSLSEGELQKLFATIGEDLAVSFKERMQASDDKMAEVIHIMEELGYETIASSAQESSTAQSSEIIAKNCVFHDLAVENKAVCQLDIALISSLLDAEIEQTECMVKGGDSCRFCIKQ